jgi:probable phosphoglycerate mutase
MNLTMCFLRHGETASSRTHTFCGALDPDMSENGHKMAEDFAKAYKDLPWDAVYCSPMKRAIASVGPFCEATGLETQIRDGLREIAYGKWEGMTPEEVSDNYHDEFLRWDTDPGWCSPTGGEKGVDIARRSGSVLAEIEEKHPEGNVLVVSHKATIRIIMCTLLGVDVGRFRDRIGCPTGSVTTVAFTDHGPLILQMADRSYLRDELYTRGSAIAADPT